MKTVSTIALGAKANLKFVGERISSRVNILDLLKPQKK